MIEHGANIAAVEPNGCTVLWLACSWGDYAIVEELIKRGSDVNAGANAGYVPLAAAAAGCNSDVVKLLLKYGADPNRRDSHGESPLLLAAAQVEKCLNEEQKTHRITTIQSLVDCGADVNAKGANGWTVLDHAEFNSLSENPGIADLFSHRPAEYLRSKGAKPRAEL